jgi:hypothetical protein
MVQFVKTAPRTQSKNMRKLVLLLIVLVFVQLSMSYSSSSDIQRAASSQSFGIIQNYVSADTINCTSNNFCILAGSLGSGQPAVYTSANSGSSWNLLNVAQLPGPVTEAACSNPTNCVIASENQATDLMQFYTTSSGGNSWNQVQVPGSESITTAIYCNSSSTCLVFGENQTSSITGAISYDGGNTWISLFFPSTVASIFSVSCTSNMCFAVGNSFASGPAFIYSQLGSTTFQLGNPPAGSGYLTSISCASVCFSSGSDQNSNPAIYEFNGTWSKLSIPASSVINSVSCSQSSCFSVGNVSGSIEILSVSFIGAVSNISNTFGPGSLEDISCGTFFCAAYGYSPQDPLIAISNYTGSFVTSSGFNSTNLGPISYSSCAQNSSTCVFAEGSIYPDTLYYSLDAGLDLSAASIPSDVGSISGLSCGSSTNCAAIGFDTSGNAIALYSTNSGASYTGASIPTGLAEETAISCYLTTCVIFALSVNGSLSALYSTNSGASYAASSGVLGINSVNTASCSSSSCVAFGESSLGPVGIYSTNSGVSYSNSTIISGISTIESVSCFGSTCDAIGLNSSGSTISVYSTDSGAAFNQSSLPTGVQNPTSVSCGSALQCYFVASNSYGLSISMYGSSNSGSSFFSVSTPAIESSVTTLSCAAATTCLVSGGVNSGMILAIEPPPVLSSISSNQGPVGGGVPVVISGSGFTGSISVDFGTQPASDIIVDSSTSISVLTPSQSTIGAVLVTVTDNFGVSNSLSYTYVNNSTLTGANQFVPIVPVRIVDTRSSSNNPYQYAGSMLGSGETINIQVTNYTNAQGVSDNIPASATAVVLNVTGLDATSYGDYFTIWPSSSNMPLASSLNLSPGQTIANFVTVELGSTGKISLYNAFGQANAILDVEGYYEAQPNYQGLYNPIAPYRICDTRNGQNNTTQCKGKTLQPGQTLTITAAGLGAIPASGISAIIMNLTVTNPSANNDYLTVWPTGSSIPTASVINFNANQTIANRVAVELGSSNEISIYNPFGTVDIIVDVNGWFASTTNNTGFTLNTVNPTRVCDTRNSAQNNTQCNDMTLSPGATLTISIASNTSGDGVPSPTSANPPTAAVLNVTVTNTTSDGGYLTIYPTGISLPLASDLNWQQNETIANASIVELGPNGTISIYNAYGNTDVIVDVLGWYS